jgi:hypothetical protein
VAPEQQETTLLVEVALEVVSHFDWIHAVVAEHPEKGDSGEQFVRYGRRSKVPGQRECLPPHRTVVLAT